MSDNLIIPHSDQTQHYLNYYPQYVNTTGVTVVLRVNSGQSQANYTVWGNWLQQIMDKDWHAAGNMLP